jgi:rhodanese-related sulfurtransferase
MGLLDIFGFGKREKMIEEALSKGAVIVDVRSTMEFKSGNIEGSINIPLDIIEDNIHKLKDMNNAIVLCCASGMRSGSAKSILQRYDIECYNGGGWHSLS